LCSRIRDGNRKIVIDFCTIPDTNKWATKKGDKCISNFSSDIEAELVWEQEQQK
jgi:hypothetical protein